MNPSPLQTQPSSTYADAAARIARFVADEDDALIHPASHTKFWTHGEKTARAVLYLQGYTDSTEQFRALGDLLHQRGYNVFAPRLLYHGYRDRMTREHGKLTAPELIQWANDAVNTAHGLGEKLTVVGLSLGGVMATWLAQNRADVERVLIVAPAYGTKAIPPRATRTAARVVQRLPNMFIWWDPRVRAATGIEYAYPRFATHTLAQLFLLGSEMLNAARQRPPAAGAVWMITNANDFAVSNALCAEFVAAWRKHNANQIFTYQFPRELGLPHDLLDPIDATVKPELVYPRLIEMVQ
ncbi:MAG: alpha/beta hydrolase [Chloroflexi bacterium]|nr:alpha/beta hydrolase [Chloroflexota bacterium]